jgi:hypothetical protein
MSVFQKSKKMKLLCTITLLAITILASAQEVEKKHHQQIGAHAGFTTGVGISYRYWPGRLGIQTTFIPVKTDTVTFISFGLTGLCTLSEQKNFKAFLFLGNHLITRNSKQEYNIGFGPGFSVGSAVRFNLMIGYGFFDVTNSFNMLPTGEIGIYYKF